MVAFAGLAGDFLGWFAFTGPGFPVVHFFAVSTFITTNHILSEYTSLIVRTRASRAVNDLMDLQPDTARRRRRRGRDAVDESVATGESAPTDKSPGDELIGGSVNETGTLLFEVTAVGDETFLNQVARQIGKARAMKPDIVQLADRILK